MMHFAIASHRPIDVLEPLAGLTGAFTCTPNALSSWAMATGAGGRCIYARATRLSGSLAERARLLSRGGALQINQARNERDRTLFDFIATRTARPMSIPATAIDKLPSFAVAVLDVLEAVAANGMACPTNAQIAAALGGSSGQRVSDALKALEAAGMVTVTVWRTGHDGAREIRIMETGETLCAA